jgi:hypothetical protein
MKLRLAMPLIAAAAVLGAYASSPASALSRPQVFSLLDVTNNNVQPIAGFTFSRLPQAGDRFALDDVMYKWAGTKRGAAVGHLFGLCTFVSVSPPPSFHARGLCTGDFRLPAGSVLVEGTVGFTNGPSRFALPVIGGTGAYANARGFVKIRDLGTGDSSNSNVEFHLLP